MSGSIYGPVEDGVGRRRTTDHGIPHLDGEVDDHDGRADSMLIHDDLEQIATVFSNEFGKSEIVGSRGLGFLKRS